LNAPARILDPLKKLAVRHVGYGVKPEHYTYMGNALLRTLEKGLGEDFTPDLRKAWVAAFQTLTAIMKEAAYGPAITKSAPLAGARCRDRVGGDVDDSVVNRDFAAGYLSASTRSRAIGHPRMTGAVGKALDRLITAKVEIGRARLADRPAAFALRQLEQ
jgi:hypothetical protein